VFWGYNAATNVANAAVSIKNAQGQVVYSEMGSLNAGPGTFRWDGMGSDGNVQPNGIYTIEIAGTNLAGKPVEVSTSSVGIVTGVDFTGSVPVLQVGRSKVAITDVTDVRIPEASPPPSGGDEDDEEA